MLLTTSKPLPLRRCPHQLAHDVDPEAWLLDVLARLATHPAKHIGQLLPWAWPMHRLSDKAAA